MIAERCLYGVDRNPLAVQMARLSLWLVTLSKEKSFTFLNHAVKCGDSLLGLSSLRQAETLHLRPPKVQQTGLWEQRFRDALAQAVEKRELIESFTVSDVAQAERKQALLLEAEQAMDLARRACDILCSAAIRTADGNAAKRGDKPHKPFEQLRSQLLAALDDESGRQLAGLHRDAMAALEQGNPDKKQPRHPFHWPLEFPEVFAAGGFDAIVGNPPFLGGQRLTGPLGKDYRDYLVDTIAEGRRGSADLCAYFYLRAASLLRVNGNAGLLATNTIAQGDTREVALEAMTESGVSIYRAVKSRKWPGEAALEIAQIWFRKGPWGGVRNLESAVVKDISPYLVVPGTMSGKPKRLKENEGKSFQGSIVLGMGFILPPDEAKSLLAKDPRNKDVLFPYLNGEDLNSRPDQSPSRWVINFHDWPIERAKEYTACFRIVEEKVKPERLKSNRKIRRERWWQFAERATGLYESISECDRVLATARVSPTRAVEWVDSAVVFNDKVVVFTDTSDEFLAIMQSSLHWVWANLYCATLGAVTLNYSPSDAFETFPFCESTSAMGEAARNYQFIRTKIMTSENIGLTKLYNHFHDPSSILCSIDVLRELHKVLNEQVTRAYGWDDLDLGHGFHTTEQGVRFTISEKARREVMDRLLELNLSRSNNNVSGLGG
jgi:hypothetical protein